MKSFQRIFVLALALGVMSSSMLRADDQATPPPPPPNGPGLSKPGRAELMDPAQMVQRLDETLQLTDAQKAKITDILMKHAEEMQAIRDKMHAQIRDLEKAKHDQIRALLTADQQTKFDAMPPPSPGRDGHRGGPGGPGGAVPPPPAPAPTPSP